MTRSETAAGTADADLFPVSSAQARLLVAHGMHPDGAQYNVYAAFTVRGALDVPLLERCVDALVARHEALRTGIRIVDGRPAQAVLPAARVRVEVEDGVPVAAAAARLAAHAGRPFDLALAPLLRCAVLRVADGSHRLVLTSHHVVCDGWSMDLLLRELSADYRAGGPGTVAGPALQYADYAAWHGGRVAAGEFAGSVGFWREHLDGAPALTALPTDRPRTAARTADGGVERFTVPAGTVEELERVGRQAGATLFTTLFAAFSAFLGRLTGQDDLVVGTPVSGRERAELHGVVGMLVDTVALRADLGGDPAFRELVERTEARVRACRPHFDAPFESVVAALAPGRDLRHDPVFQVLFSLDDALELALDLPGAEVEELGLFLDDARFDLLLHLKHGPRGLEAYFSHRTELLSPVTVRRWAEGFTVFLADLARRPELPVGRAEILPPALRGTVLREWSHTPAGPREAVFTPVHERIARTARRRPHAPAVTGDGADLSYGELLERADALAARLRAYGAGPERVVGICRARGADTLVALLAVLRTGACYLPLDPGHPDARIAALVEGVAPVVLLTDAARAPRLRALAPALAVLDPYAPADANAPARPDGPPSEPAPTRPGQLAYTLYTSGSTGRPKAVAVTQRNLTHLVDAQRELLGLDADDRVPQYGSLTFDLSVWEIFATWVSGAVLCVAADHERLGSALLEFLGRQRVTKALLPPTALGTLPATAPAALPDLTTLISGGDVCPQRLGDAWAAGRRFLNAYGPTETTCCATVAEVTCGELPPIGRPVPGSRAYVLDRHLQPVLPGTTGEVYIGGDSPARGYSGDPAQTAGRFVADPHSPVPGARMYRTGDLAHHGPDGRLYFRHRDDNQLKHHGVRVEAAEIESVLVLHDDVGQAAVAVQPDARGEQRLTAHLVAAPGRTVEPGPLRRWLADRLPPSHLPELLNPVAALPLNSSGKVDRAALPTPPAPADDRPVPGTRGRTATQDRVAAVWADVLGLPGVGVHDNFFDLGGSSVRLLAVHAALVVDRPGLRMVDLFRHPTVATLAGHLDGARPAGDDAREAPAGRPPAAAAGRRRVQERRARLAHVKHLGE
ncbi:non-ribosomal peptide synthetase [Streptantibioticus silvisoli]|uniref:Amino acid adenylation domain-containing protein n=1 Tax=Streptantibioticus silvisoli TaxID=2705255 RepID=A0ABT6VUL1_9ACTN|nr:amino acid adenylation domain-containing protein [Streptantibioticus silvisoli]MDI5961143.1 amino acid adenylation domain-containing protein [Streptantibioticus silvisoli]